MASDQTSKVFGVSTIQQSVTNDGHVKIDGGAYCNSMMFNYMSGVTTALVGSTGLSYTFGYILSANNPVVIGGPGPIWLTSAGSTSKVNVLLSFNTNSSGV
jgi:hypothetical protein